MSAVPSSVLDTLPDAEGADILNEVSRFIGRFCVLPGEHALVAVTLWAAHSHMISHFHTTPRLAVISAELASGKTRVLEVLELLVPSAMMSVSASAAAVFRSLSAQQITLLFDEVDTIWAQKGRDDQNEDLRALLNSGYKRGATVPRCVGPNHEVRQFPVFCAAAVAGIGEPPPTIMSRAVVIKMRRRSPSERVEPFRSRLFEGLGHQLRDRMSS
jgi:hypothetical protein